VFCCVDKVVIQTCGLLTALICKTNFVVNNFSNKSLRNPILNCSWVKDWIMQEKRSAKFQQSESFLLLLFSVQLPTINITDKP